MVDGGVVRRDGREAAAAHAAHLLGREVVVVEDVAAHVGGGPRRDAIRQRAAHVRDVRRAVVGVRALVRVRVTVTVRVRVRVRVRV